jgi:hypothetical protein
VPIRDWTRVSTGTFHAFCLEHLAGCSKRESMSLKATPVTKSGLKKLAAALPKCEIVWDGVTIEPTAK